MVQSRAEKRRVVVDLRSRTTGSSIRVQIGNTADRWVWFAELKCRVDCLQICAAHSRDILSRIMLVAQVAPQVESSCPLIDSDSRCGRRIDQNREERNRREHFYSLPLARTNAHCIASRHFNLHFNSCSRISNGPPPTARRPIPDSHSSVPSRLFSICTMCIAYAVVKCTVHTVTGGICEMRSLTVHSVRNSELQMYSKSM